MEKGQKQSINKVIEIHNKKKDEIYFTLKFFLFLFKNCLFFFVTF